MTKKTHTKVTFKNYQPNQLQLPTDIELHIPTKHLVRVVNDVIDKMKIEPLLDCSDCPLRSQCTRSKGNRKLSVNFRWQELKQMARQNLTSEKGQELRAKRSVDVESVFGRLKQNWSFRRFMLRGLTKVNVELGLLCIAHNLAKKAAISVS